MPRLHAYAVMAAATFFAGTSLLLLGVFLLFGPFRVVDLGLSTGGALVLDGVLCLMFSLQHSGMVRTSFHRRLRSFVPESYHGAVYAIASGVFLLALLLLWQPTDLTLYRIQGPFRWIFHAATLGAILGFLWGARALGSGSLDAFGIRSIVAALRRKHPEPPSLSLSGPYRWVRHPLYAFVVVLLWSRPDLSADRLLLNILWTIWIYVGAFFEERDLVSDFGESYRRYQRQVPMFVPLRIPR